MSSPAAEPEAVSAPGRAWLRWWPAAWAATSVLLVVASREVESGVFVAALYLGLNAMTVLYAVLSDRPAGSKMMLVVGWGAATQLPVMLWLFLSQNSRPERTSVHTLRDGRER